MAARKGAKERYAYEPDYATEPGEILQETIDALGMTQKELADRTGYTRKHINLLISGKARITSEAALRFEKVTRVPAHFWNNLESQFQERKAKLASTSCAETQIDWLEEVPVKELIKRGAIPHCTDKIDLIGELLTFFRVASVDVWRTGWTNHQVAFRKSKGAETCTGIIAAWVRMAEVSAEKMECAKFSATKFRRALKKIRDLTVCAPEEFIPEMKRLSAEAGVAVAVEPEFPGSRVNGAARWLTPSKAMIAVNLRGKSNDRFWFTFFHEAGHLLNDDRDQVFVDIEYADDPRERAANEFASEMLIPKEFRSRLGSLRSKASVCDFANEIRIHPGIVVGRLHHERLVPHSHMRDLIAKLHWSED